MEEMKEQEAAWSGGEVHLLLPKRQLLILNTLGPEDRETTELPSDSLDPPRGSLGSQGSKQQGHWKAMIESVGDKGSADPLDKISRPKGLPELEKLLEEFRDVFPEDLPAETPPELDISMRIQIKPGSKPPHQAPYRVPQGADATI